MASKILETTGHEGQDLISHATAGTALAAGHIAAVTYDDTKRSAEIVAAAQAALAKLIQVLP